MKRLVRVLTYLSAALTIVPLLRPLDRAAKVLLWAPKLLAGALSPILGAISGLGAVLGLASRDGKLAGAGTLGAALAAKFLADIPASADQFDAAFGPDWRERLPASLRPLLLPRRFSVLAKRLRAVEVQRDLVFGHSPRSGAPLLADLWQPRPGTGRSGLGLVYAHGSGWRVGDKDLGTRPLFRRLAAQGHVILDIAYTLWPQADLLTMVAEVNQAVLWLKENGAAYGVNRERIVLMGGSAGGHLALLAAYAPNHPAFLPFGEAPDTSVRGVIAFYPPVDFMPLAEEAKEYPQAPSGPIQKAADAIMNLLFRIQAEVPEAVDVDVEEAAAGRSHSIFAQMLGGEPDEIPETYRLLSPISHVGPHCPPTLLLQGSDDVFDLAPPLRRFHQGLKAAGVPAILVEFPHTEHAFDLVLPQVSPVAQAATYDLERFLALLV